MALVVVESVDQQALATVAIVRLTAGWETVWLAVAVAVRALPSTNQLRMTWLVDADRARRSPACLDVPVGLRHLNRRIQVVVDINQCSVDGIALSCTAIVRAHHSQTRLMMIGQCHFTTTTLGARPGAGRSFGPWSVSHACAFAQWKVSTGKRDECRLVNAIRGDRVPSIRQKDCLVWHIGLGKAERLPRWGWRLILLPPEQVIHPNIIRLSGRNLGRWIDRCGVDPNGEWEGCRSCLLLVDVVEFNANGSASFQCLTIDNCV